MPVKAAEYPKLSKIYKELNRQNGIIFDAEKERNALVLERDSLKGFAKLTKKGELQSRIERKNEEIDLLKAGLLGIAKRYGFHTVHDFYKSYHTAKTDYIAYQEKSADWEKTYGKKSPKILCITNFKITKKKQQIDNQIKLHEVTVDGKIITAPLLILRISFTGI